MKREPRRRKGESWSGYCERHDAWHKEVWTPERIASTHQSAQAWQESRRQLAESACRLQEDYDAQMLPLLESGKMMCLEIPLQIMGGDGRAARLTRNIYLTPHDYKMYWCRLWRLPVESQRPADHCMQHEPHSCFMPTGKPNWCYIEAQPPIPGNRWLLGMHPHSLDQIIHFKLCCPQAARLKIRSLHAEGWRNIKLSTKEPVSEDAGQFIRYMQARMPCLNQ